jgi:hypothetical protein
MDDHHLAVDDGFAWNGERAGNLGKALGPIQTVAGEDLLPAAVKMNLNAIAVVLDFVKPLVALGRPGLQRRELGLNEPRHAIRFGNNSTHKKPAAPWGNSGHFTYFSKIPNNQGM